MITKHQTILKFIPFEGEFHQDVASFSNEDEDNERPELYVMSIEDWYDFGEPIEITLTVEPGDLLNV